MALEEVVFANADGAALPDPLDSGSEVAEELAVSEEGVLAGNSVTESVNADLGFLGDETGDGVA